MKSQLAAVLRTADHSLLLKTTASFLREMPITTAQDDRILHFLDRQKRSLTTPSIGKDMEQ